MFIVLEIPGVVHCDPLHLVLAVGFKTLGTRRVKKSPGANVRSTINEVMLLFNRHVPIYIFIYSLLNV